MTTKKVNLLTIGPLPPPIAGTSVSFKQFTTYVERFPEQIELKIINSAPRQLGQKPLLTTSHFNTARNVLGQLIAELRWADKVLVFGSNQFQASLGAICVLVAKLVRKPIYLSVFGGSFDNFYRCRNALWQRLMLTSLKAVDGLILQTAMLADFFRPLLGERVYQTRGYRQMAPDLDLPARSALRAPLRLVFVGHVREEKGVFVLLDALQQLADTASICCDIIGPIYAGEEARFERELAQTPNASYLGVLEPSMVLPALAQYDAFVFPTFYQGEGHPGVLVEAMMVGLPMITTRHRAIPEIVQDGHNGLLVEVGNSAELAQAICRLATDPALYQTLAANSAASAAQYDADSVLADMLRLIGIPV